MDSKLLLTIATVATLLGSITLISHDAQVAQLQSQWASWKNQQNKLYQTAEEEAYRFAVFCENVVQINKHNQEEHDFTLGVNAFTDLTGQEFKALYHSGYKKSTLKSSTTTFHAPAGYMASGSVDWVSKGAVTPVKNQGQCGSCWAFGTVGGIEGGYFVSGNPLTSFSEQQITSCDTRDSGCGGGDLPSAYNYVNGAGLCTEQNYPYSSGGGSSGYCQLSSHQTYIQAGAVSGQAVGSNNRNDFLSALDRQPLSICIEADSSVFQSYSGGVITSGCGSSLDHCVTAVAYDLNASQPYVRIKNSWASSWGDNGYVNVGIQSQSGSGVCGVYEEPYLATF